MVRFTFISQLSVAIGFFLYSVCDEVVVNGRSGVFFNEEYLRNFGEYLTEECENLLQLFANATQHFNWCMIKYARPLRMCEKCAEQYSKVLARYPNSSRCVNDLIKSERFQVVTKVYDFQTGVWHSAHCSKCYTSETSEWNLTHHTQEFFHRLRRVRSCFANHTIIQPSHNVSHMDGLCNGCAKHYLSLRDMYNVILQETTDSMNEDQLCVDVMSLMNDTQKDWTSFNCNKVKEKNYNVLSLTGGFGLLTLLFYVGVKKHEKFKNRIQTRSRRARQVVNYDSE